jgi:hypothetical protein
MDFGKIRRSTPSIHVFCATGGVTLLRPGNEDQRYENRQYSSDFTKGNGDKDYPFQYRNAAPVSPHYAIIDLWLGFRDRTMQANAQTIFIKINHWLLQIGPDGVTAADGHFTKLAV